MDFKRKKQLAGYTLIELMVVLAIMGLLASVVLPYIPSDQADRMREEADRFESLVSYAQTHAILQSQDLGLIVNELDYTFLQKEGDSWQALTEEPLIAQKLDNYLIQTLSVEGEVIDTGSLDEVVPTVLLFSSGEITPFEYTLALSEQQLVRLSFNLLGEIEREFVDEVP